jgi:hypothetical protein
VVTLEALLQQGGTAERRASEPGGGKGAQVCSVMLWCALEWLCTGAGLRLKSITITQLLGSQHPYASSRVEQQLGY